MNTRFSQSRRPLFRPRWSPLLTALVACGLIGCKPSDEPEASGNYRVATTVGMITDVTRQLTGELAQVEGIIGEGIDPHLYKPAVSDVKLLDAADIVFYNGLLLEGRMQDVLKRLAATGKPVFAVTDGIAEDSDYYLPGEGDHHDPHVWMDVSAWKKATATIARELERFDPTHATTYQANLESYSKQLDLLDDYARKSLATIPEQRRILITAHDAFNYMARAYGLEVRGIQGISTESEAGLKDIKTLVDLIVERQIPAVFVESSVSDKSVLALVEGARARGHEIAIGGQLYSDAMGSPGSYEGSYIGMIDHNITTIARALGGEAPAGGMQGKLSP